MLLTLITGLLALLAFRQLATNLWGLVAFDSDTPTESSITMPESERAFINTVAGFEGRYNSADNELQKSRLRAERAAKILGAASPKVQGWVGTLEDMETTRDGNAYITIKLAASENIKVETWNNAFSDISTDTLIPMNSELYSVLSHLSTGQEVRFDGTFFSSGQDGFSETSLTEEGSMTDPDFLMKFSSIEAYR